MIGCEGMKTRQKKKAIDKGNLCLSPGLCGCVVVI